MLSGCQVLCLSVCIDPHRPNALQDKGLWVDKYTPRSFLELLGDEEINREVVRWLKSWDKCVFGEKYQPGHKPRKRSTAARGLSTRQYADVHPKEKILLICGSPGKSSIRLCNSLAPSQIMM